MANPIYLDYQATTPLDPRAFEAMRPYFEDKFGNPHSSTHRYGWEAAAGVDVARDQIAEGLDVKSAEVLFTSGATEANNLAIKGVMRAHQSGHMITVATEHKCVLESALALEREGFDVTYLPVRKDGLIDLDDLRSAFRDDTRLVSVMAVNNEIGVIQPMAEIAEIAHEKGALFHCDAAQAFGKIAFKPKSLGVDIASLSGHKIYGPKGVGAIYIRSGSPLIRLQPHMDGGGQEGGIRSGTLSPALCVGFGVAVSLAQAELEQEQERAHRHFERLLFGLREAIPDLILNGSIDHRLYSNLNVSIPNVDGERLLSDLRQLAVSSGAACASALSGPSYVLEALSVPKKLAQASLRIGTGRFTTDADIETAIDAIKNAVQLQKAKA